MDGHLTGTLAVLVVGIVPHLVDGDLGLLGSVAVGYGEAFDLAGVACHGILSDAVNDLLAVCVDGQVLEGVVPVHCSGQLDGLNLLAVSQQVDGHLTGTLAVLVVGIVPHLVDGDLGLLGSVAVGNSQTFDRRSVAAFGIHDFTNGEIQGIAGQQVNDYIFKGIIPSVGIRCIFLGQFYGFDILDPFAGGFIVDHSGQHNLNVLGALAVLVVGVVPQLCDVDIYLFDQVLHFRHREDDGIAIYIFLILAQSEGRSTLAIRHSGDHRIQGGRQVGIDPEAASLSCHIDQLQIILQYRLVYQGCILAKGPGEHLRGCAVAIVILKQPGLQRIVIGVGELIGSLNDLAFAIGFGGNHLSDVYHTANGQDDSVGIIDELEVADLGIVTDVVFHIGASGSLVNQLCFDGPEEVFVKGGQGIIVIAFFVRIIGMENNITGFVTLIVPHNRSFALTSQFSQIVHKCMTQLDSGRTGVFLALNVFRTILIVRRLTTDRVTIVTGCNQLLPNLNTLILCALIVQRMIQSIL